MTETPSSTFRHILDSNLVSFYEVAHAFLPEMCSRGRGRIIAMGMTGAQSTTPMRACGAAMAAKSGLTALVRTLALEIASSGITANIINPGDIREKQLTRSEARAKKLMIISPWVTPALLKIWRTVPFSSCPTRLRTLPVQ